MAGPTFSDDEFFGDPPPPPVTGNGDRVAAAGPGPLRFRTARELAESTPDVPEWIHEGTLVAGGTTEIDGKAKLAGKSTFIGHLARAILDGQPFLGRPTRKGPVIWLTEEGDPAFRQTLKRCDLAARDDLHILTYALTIGTEWPEVVSQARQLADRCGARVLVVDTLPRFAHLRDDAENSAGAALAAMDPIVLAAAGGLAIVVSRHDRRAGGEVGESGRGSTAFTGAVDIVLHLTRVGGGGREYVRQLDGIGRFPEVPDQLLITLGDDGYKVLGTAADYQRQAAADLLLEHLPAAEEEAVTLASLWVAAKAPKDGKPGAAAGPLAGTKLGARTFERAAAELLAAGQVCKGVVHARKTVWWVCAPRSGGRGVQANGTVQAPDRDNVHHAPPPIGGRVGARASGAGDGGGGSAQADTDRTGEETLLQLPPNGGTTSATDGAEAELTEALDALVANDDGPPVDHAEEE